MTLPIMIIIKKRFNLGLDLLMRVVMILLLLMTANHDHNHEQVYIRIGSVCESFDDLLALDDSNNYDHN